MRTDAANVYERRGPTRGAQLSERQELRPVPAGCAQKYRHPRQRDRDVGVSASEGVARIDDHAAVTGKDDAAPVQPACAAFVIWAGVRPPHSFMRLQNCGGEADATRRSSPLAARPAPRIRAVLLHLAHRSSGCARSSSARGRLADQSCRNRSGRRGCCHVSASIRPPLVCFVAILSLGG